MSRQQMRVIVFRIKELREYRKLTQQTMAAELDITTKSYANIENGITDPSLSRLLQITKLLEIPLHELADIQKPIEEIIAEQYFKKKFTLPKKN